MAEITLQHPKVPDFVQVFQAAAQRALADGQSVVAAQKFGRMSASFAFLDSSSGASLNSQWLARKPEVEGRQIT